jgi:hypothetical protein
MGSDEGEFRGATRAEIRFIKEQLSSLRLDLKEISSALADLRDFRTKVLAYAGLMAAAATLCIQFLMDRLNGGG